MPIGTNTEVRNVRKDSTDVVDAADISGGETFGIGGVAAVTLFIAGTAGDDITVELSPDGGTSWYTPDESPATINADGTVVVHLTYAATDVRVTNSTGTNATTVQVVERAG